VEERVLVGARERGAAGQREAIQVELPLEARDFGVAEVPVCEKGGCWWSFWCVNEGKGLCVTVSKRLEAGRTVRTSEEFRS
jgi:hypothetical protein